MADRARINKRGQAAALPSRSGHRHVTVPIFLLVPEVKMPKRLDLTRDAERAQDAPPGLIAVNGVEQRIR